LKGLEGIKQMQYRTELPILDDDLPEDDIDRLFSQLELIEPPPSVIANVLEQVAAYVPISHPPFFPQSAVMLHELGHWAVQQKKRSLC
jgi:hypothetical protein